MSILTQILILLLVLGLFYAVIINNRETVKHIVSLLPDFSKIFPKYTPPALSQHVKVIVFVPDAHAEAVRQAIGSVGGGDIGNYAMCSFSTQGIARYLPKAGAHPSVGTIGKLELVEEEKIEVTVARAHLSHVIEAIKRVHPYEEAEIYLYALEPLPGGITEDGHHDHTPVSTHHH